MSMPAISKHLKVLQRAGLIERGREAQWRPCRLAAGAAERRVGLARTLSPFLGRELRSPRGLSARAAEERTEKKGAQEWTQEVILPPNPTDRELVVTRVFNAPRELVWKALTEPERLEHWWGPKGFTSRIQKLELRPGGTFLYNQRNAEGLEMWGKWVYREIDRAGSAGNHLFVYRREGQFSRATHFNRTGRSRSLTESTFTEHQGRTTITIRMTPINATESERKTFDDGRNSMEQGFAGTFDEARPIPGNALRRHHQLAEGVKRCNSIRI